jgi:hypothetical protein
VKFWQVTLLIWMLAAVIGAWLKPSFGTSLVLAGFLTLLGYRLTQKNL